MPEHPRQREILDHLEKVLGHRFERPELAVQALTHSSAKDRELPCNERLEFLGDSILGHVVSEYLYQMFPNKEEGELSTMKSVIVSAKTLSALAYELEFDKLVILGRGLNEKSEVPRSILCNCFEAVVAALHLDGGFEKARGFILSQIRRQADTILRDEHEKNYKSLLQDHAQRTLGTVPGYAVLKESGPDHRKRFQISVELGGRSYAPAWGDNKREAEQKAARAALLELGLIDEGRSNGEDPG